MDLKGLANYVSDQIRYHAAYGMKFTMMVLPESLEPEVCKVLVKQQIEGVELKQIRPGHAALFLHGVQVMFTKRLTGQRHLKVLKTIKPKVGPLNGGTPIAGQPARLTENVA
jgi:hypothetical protein